MEPEGISGLVTALVGALTAGGGAVAFFVNRADKKREAGEGQVIATLRERVSELKAEVQSLLRKIHRMRRAGDKWREQLIENDIKPDPGEWPEDPDEQ
ncbi:hypothetical protein [Arthrobacter sp. RCC_34]|uniref:hypothetical protein n=1 Tax=Arthrobacter sp. RCC_34 TaxID=3239230 RepID=UPI0035268955